jgi:dTMP kinase
MSKNLFIALEGIDGSGKTTQIPKMAAFLEENGHKVYATAEPTRGPIGRMIRDIFAGKMEGDHRVIAALFAADRLQHLLDENNGLLSKLKEGYTVLTDRYYLSSYAYHGVHTDLDWVVESNRISKELLQPDVHIYIDMDPVVSMQRINATRPSAELYETEDNLRSVKNAYEIAISRIENQEKIARVNGNDSEDKVFKDVKKILEQFM